MYVIKYMLLKAAVATQRNHPEYSVMEVLQSFVRCGLMSFSRNVREGIADIVREYGFDVVFAAAEEIIAELR